MSAMALRKCAILSALSPGDIRFSVLYVRSLF
jgi:hypothetical protein